jgi:hypothetical protein
MGEGFVGIPGLLNKQAGGTGEILSMRLVVVSRVGFDIDNNGCFERRVDVEEKSKKNLYYWRI